MEVRCTARCAVALSAVAVFCAAPASADAADDAVVAALAKRNIVINDGNRDAMLAEAHMVCDGLDKHYKTSTLAMKLVGDTDLNFSQSSFFIGVAVAAYCPQYKGHSGSPAGWLNPGPPLM
ncbi:DUF732 domain-containing protein [Mycobacterium sp.]|uniref:DUF732 domain-containing protein n=1 Tax=Mycobacterium sp. TaxID=1785 RepID=UPI003BB0AA7D